MSGIVESLERLLNLTSKASGVLDDIADREAISERRGIVYAEEYPDIANDSNVRTEVISVYSYLILTEDGPFEMPLGWSADGDYPSGTPVPDPLPASLLNSGGTLSLDTDAQYYQQKRVHISVFLNADIVSEDRFQIDIAPPFDGYYHGLQASPAQTWTPKLYLQAKPGLTGAALDRLNELLAADITQETL